MTEEANVNVDVNVVVQQSAAPAAAPAAKPKKAAKVAKPKAVKATQSTYVKKTRPIAVKKVASPVKAAVCSVAAHKPKKVVKSAAGSSHPPYLEMVTKAVIALNERKGSSRHAIRKFIIDKFLVGTDPKSTNLRLKQALIRGVTSGVLQNTKGATGAAGSFRVSEALKTEKVVKKTTSKPVVAKKPKVIKKAASPKKPMVAANKPMSPKKHTSPKKVVNAPRPKVVKRLASPKKVVPKKAVAAKTAKAVKSPKRAIKNTVAKM